MHVSPAALSLGIAYKAVRSARDNEAVEARATYGATQLVRLGGGRVRTDVDPVERTHVAENGFLDHRRAAANFAAVLCGEALGKLLGFGARAYRCQLQFVLSLEGGAAWATGAASVLTGACLRAAVRWRLDFVADDAASAAPPTCVAELHDDVATELPVDAVVRSSEGRAAGEAC